MHLVSRKMRKKMMEKATSPLEYEQERHRIIKPEGSIGGTLWIWKYRMDDLLKQGQWDEALKRLQQLRDEEGLQVSVVGYTKLLHYCNETNKLKQAQELFQQMLAEGVKPDHYVFTELLDLYRKNNQIDQAMDLFWSMQQDYGIKPTSRVFGVLLLMRAERNQWEEFDVVLRMMKRQNVRPDSFGFARILQAVSQMKNEELMEKMLTLMREQCVKADWIVYRVLMEHYKSTQNIEKLKEYYARARKKFKIPVKETLRNIMGELIDSEGNLVEQQAQA